ncbi:MAG: phosphodiester glycosidase family protein, partial [Oscillospiraceae bacterium]|nr:phosphodiester glycosidase family protein [Oscillospiraceae bacterium]
MKHCKTWVLRLAVLVLLLSLMLPLLPKGQAASLYTVKSTSSKTLAPGITQKIHTASYGDGTANVKYYVATADITRSDVMVLNGYKDNNPKFGACNSVTVDQQILASDKAHQDPNNPSYIENYRVVAGCNGGFFNIPSISGIPNYMGAHIMEGVQYWTYDGRPFMAILKDGTAVVGAGTSDWNKYREHMQEAISGNVLLVNKGKNNTGNVDEDKAFVGQESSKLGTGRHPRTCCGVTQDGKVVMIVVDAQTTGSSSVRGGATLNEVAQMLIDAGCYYAINMDGGGSSTYLTKEEGTTTPTLINKPSDGSMRAICGSLLFASTAPQDHLSFEFDGTGSQRYARKQYARRNYDLANYWATGLAGSLTLKNYAVEMDNTAGTMTINLNDRGDTGHSTYLAPGAKDGTFNDAEATTSTAFTYDPSNAEVFRVRLKFNNATRYSSTNTPFVGLSYLPGDTRTWSGVVLKANISDEYIDGGSKEGQYVTLEVDLSNHKIRNCPSLVSMMIQIGYLKKGTCTIDSIYIGPKSGNKLHFGFAEIGTNLNGFNDPAYGHLDFDKEGHWYKGAELASYDINHGVLTMTVDASPSNPNNAYVETSLTSSKSVHPLFYTPKAGDILQVRYKVESYDSATNTSLYGAEQKPTLTIYGYNDRQNVYKNPSALTIDTSQKGYVVKEWTVPTEWTSYDMTKLRLTMRYFVNSTIKIDYIYVGPRAEAPAYNKFFIGFDNTDADKARYEGVSYGGMNMDAPGNWCAGSEYNLPVISGGAIKVTPSSTYTGYGYIHSGGSTSAYPLYYKPNSEDYIQVRFKIDNGVSADKYESQKGNGRFAFYYGNKTVGARASYVYHDFKVADVSNKGYVIFTYKLKDMKTSGTNMTALSEVTSIAPCFNWILADSGKTLNIYIDYIYIGPLGTVPTPQYTVTFKDAAGNTLATQKVYKGYSASYSGATPTKAADATNHYTFKGWDKSANNIQADTVITAQYTATAHSFSYTKVNTTDHKASCSCGYSRNEAHSYSYKATTNPTTSATGVITGTCSKCAQTTTITLPKLNTTDYTKTVTKAATCTATGTDSYKWKTTTYGSYTFTAATAALGHKYNSGVITTKPTLTAKGVKTFTCQNDSSHSYTEAVEMLHKALFFDFSNDAAAKTRYNNYVYNFKSFDQAAAWRGRTTGWQDGTVSMDTAASTITVKPKVTGYSSIYADSVNFDLNYDPDYADYFQMRFKATGLSGSSGIASIHFYYKTDTTHVVGDSVSFEANYFKSGEYYIATGKLQNAIRALEEVNRVVIYIAGFTAPADLNAAVTFDYAYVGPWDTLPNKDELYFNFGNTAADQTRYNTRAYGYTQFDNATAKNWFYKTDRVSNITIDNTAGTLTIQSNPTLGTTAWPDVYADTNIGPTGTTFPLKFHPEGTEYFQIRFKMKNFKVGDMVETAANGTTSTKTIAPYMNLRYFTNNTFTSYSATDSYSGHAAYINSDSYMVVTLPLLADFKNAGTIDKIRVYFGGIESISTTQVGQLTIDYIYIGKLANLPTPAYTVTFKDAAGKTLQTQLVNKGESAKYSGATPTKASDGSYHYTFKGWDKALTNIQADTTITATYTATAHSYTYSQIDHATHNASCSCGYSKTEGHSHIYTKVNALIHVVTCKNCDYSAEITHSYKDGYCICGEPEVKEPVEEASLKLNHSLNLASDISVNLLISKTLLEGFDMSTVYVESTVDRYEGNQLTGTSTIRIEPVENGNYYYFTLNGLTAVQMNDRISSVLHGTKKGQPYCSPVDEYSIAAYAYSQMNNPDRPEALKIHCADLLRYGAKAQIFKNYRTNAL